MRSIVRSVITIAMVAASLTIALPARAGGGCHALTNGSGSVVVIEDACFTPSIISIQPGESVTFVNRDPFAHNVSGTGWGHYEDLAQDDRFTMQFADDGLYPFACTLHPGMNGVIEVGDGEGPANGQAVLPQLITLPNDLNPPPPAAPAAANGATEDGSLFSATALALLAGIGVGLGIAAFRRRASARVAANEVAQA